MSRTQPRPRWRLVAAFVMILGAAAMPDTALAHNAGARTFSLSSGTPLPSSASIAAVATVAPSPHRWLWPVAESRRVLIPFRAPEHAYGPGHRGIDITAPRGSVLRAPADGVVAFRGTVVDRPLLTLDHGEGLVTTLEPALSDLAPGTTVRTGDVVGTVAHGGHAPVDTLHVGLRHHGVYINPLLLFGGVPRAVLLPLG